MKIHKALVVFGTAMEWQPSDEQLSMACKLCCDSITWARKPQLVSVPLQGKYRHAGRFHYRNLRSGYSYLDKQNNGPLWQIQS